MRRYAAFLALGVIASGGAHASSIVTIQPMTDKIGPSMVMMGAAEPARSTAPVATDSRTANVGPDVVRPSGTSISPSIVAFGEALPDIAYEKVAAIPEPKERPRAPLSTPMVMRGGIIGDAFPAPPPPEPLPEDAAAASAGDAPASDAPSDPAAPDQPAAMPPETVQ